MEEFIAQISSLAFSPVTSQSMFVQLPSLFSFVFGCFSLVFLLLRRL